MQFANPSMLWGLLAVIIPVIVHLFNFRRYRKVYFSNVAALRELHTESRRHNELRRYLVLLCRMLAVAFLVLAFAHPVLPRRGTTVHNGGVAVSVYIDNSYSMESATTDGSLLYASVQKAREIAAAYSLSDRFQLLTNDLDGTQMRWLNRDEFLSALQEIQPSPAAPMMSRVLERQAGFLGQSGAANRYAYVLSDFQQSTADLESLPADSTVHFTLIPVSGVGSDNVYIDTLRLGAPAYFVGATVDVEATISNGGSRDAEKIPVKLVVNGRERAVATVDVPAGGSAQTVLRFRLDSIGWVDCMVHVDDYPVCFDDDYHFTFHVGDQLRMLEIYGKRPNANLQRLFSLDSAVGMVSSATLGARLSDGVDFLVLHEPSLLVGGDASQIADWVGDGGSLLVVPSAVSVADGLNDMLSAMRAPTFGEWNAQRLRASTVDYSNSLYHGVFSGQSDEMEMPSANGHYRLATQQAVYQNVIGFADGSPLLTVTPYGQGRIFLFSMPLADEWTDFMSQALFVPTLYNMALYSRPLPPPAYTLGGTEPIVLRDNYESSKRPPELTGPEITALIPDLRRIGGRQVLVPHGEVRKAGIYHLADEHISFNYPRRESRLATYSADEVAHAIEGRKEYSMLSSTARSLDVLIRERDNGRPLWRLCLVLALLALAVEELLLRLKK